MTFSHSFLRKCGLPRFARMKKRERKLQQHLPHDKRYCRVLRNGHSPLPQASTLEVRGKKQIRALGRECDVEVLPASVDPR